MANGQTDGLGLLFSCLSIFSLHQIPVSGAIVAAGVGQKKHKVGEPSMCVGLRWRDLSKCKPGQDRCEVAILEPR